VLGSVLASACAGGMDGTVDRLPAGAASESVGAAHEVAGQIGGNGAANLIASANDAFVSAMSTTSGIAAAIALAGAPIAATLLPARPRTDSVHQHAVLPAPAAA
jgi:MFS transporter, DHA2 family, multidrug resistance protein